MINIETIKLRPNSTLKDAIEVINNGCAQVACVLDDNNQLIGLVTDGDIRRGILQGTTLSTSVDEVMNSKFVSCSVNDSESAVFELMRNRNLRHMPIVDNEGKLQSLKLRDGFELCSDVQNPVVIMAGGKGKRLGSYTDNCPKPMLKVGGKPMLEIIIEQCKSAGFKNFLISVNYLKEQIIEYFSDGQWLGVKIEYIEEKFEGGTAGSLSLIRQIITVPFLLINADILSTLNLRKLLKFHLDRQPKITVCVREHIYETPFGVLEISGSSVLSLKEKPIVRYPVAAGLYLLDPSVLELIPENKKFDMPNLITSVLDLSGEVAPFYINEYWLDVGFPEALEKAVRDWG